MKTTIIGSGFAGLSTAAVLAKKGYDVTVLEKNKDIGGRARCFTHSGYNFDMGPSWYWMPDIFDKFFSKFGKKSQDFYQLIKLDPGFKIIFNNNEALDIPASYKELEELFEKVEPNSSKKLQKFMHEAKFKYNFSMNSLVYQPGVTWTELISKDIFKNIFKLQVFSSYKQHVARYFKNPKLRTLLEFPVLFLGTAPKDTPALYSLMAYSGFVQGTYYPMGGFFKVIEGMANLCQELGVNIKSNENVTKIHIQNQQATSIETQHNIYSTDIVVGAADYHHVDNNLIDKKYQNYNSKYWEKRTLSPSCLLFYLGINKKLEKLIHHNLFFDANIDKHIKDIYKDQKWPENPLFYACCPSKTDPFSAPKGKENLFLLIPISPGLQDSKDLHEKYFNLLIDRLEKYCGENISNFIEYKRSYCINNFIEDYNSYKGNAYGLANTLFQTANFKPSIKNKNIQNLYYSGQLTVPGPGVPPSLISGQVVGEYIMQKHPLK